VWNQALSLPLAEKAAMQSPIEERAALPVRGRIAKLRVAR
jgi:hypothetical protein